MSYVVLNDASSIDAALERMMNERNVSSIDAALERMLNERHDLVPHHPPRPLMSPLPQEADDDASEEPTLDVAKFVAQYEEVRTKLEEASTRVQRAEHAHQEHSRHVVDAIDHLAHLELDGDSLGMISDVINANMRRFVEELRLPALQAQKEAWVAKLRRLEPLLRTVRDDMRKERECDDDLRNACPICFTKEVDTAFVPCGHVLCGACARLASPHCFTCNALVHRTIRIYV